MSKERNGCKVVWGVYDMSVRSINRALGVEICSVTEDGGLYAGRVESPHQLKKVLSRAAIFNGVETEENSAFSRCSG